MILTIVLLSILSLALCLILLIVSGQDEALEAQVKAEVMESARLLALSKGLESAFNTSLKALKRQREIIEQLRADRVSDLTKAFVARSRSQWDIIETLRKIEGAQ